MPDWTYHPIWRPLMFRLPGEDARILTIGYLDLQGRTRLGRAVFRLLSHGIPEPRYGVDALGISFPSRFGFGPGLDRDGRAAPVCQFLGCGFLTVGPISSMGRPRRRALDTLRLADTESIAWSDLGYSPSVYDVATRLEKVMPLLKIPLGVAVFGTEPELALARLGRLPAFVSVRLAAEDASSPGSRLDELRSATLVPLLLRLDLTTDDEAAVDLAESAVRHGFDGVVVGDGDHFGGLPEGRSTGPASTGHALRLVAAIRDRCGPDLPLIASGTVLTPPDAAACIAAGATLVEITGGWVYSGPGIAARSLAPTGPRQVPSNDASQRPAGWTRHTRWWAAASVVLAIAALLLQPSTLHDLARDGVLLAKDAPTRPGASSASLAACAAVLLLCQRVHAYGRRWAVWLVLVSLLVLSVVSPALGLSGALYVIIRGAADRELPSTFRALFDGPPPAWRWSAASLGRFAIAMGVVVMLVPVLFVATASAAIVTQVSVVGGTGLVVLLRAMYPGARYVWWLSLAWLIAFGFAAILVLARDPAIGFGMPASALATAGLLWLWRPLIQSDESDVVFADV